MDLRHLVIVAPEVANWAVEVVAAAAAAVIVVAAAAAAVVAATIVATVPRFPRWWW